MWIISVPETSARKANTPIFQLQVALLGTEPPIWGRLQVPGDASLGWLHAVIQLAMGWTNCHLHQFKSGEASYSLCVDGARACPPEDCGGVWGYNELLKILKNRKHPEHKSMKEWLGRPFEATTFDVEKTNHWLRKLKWPRVTESQLRKVLMARDGYLE